MPLALHERLALYKEVDQLFGLLPPKQHDLGRKILQSLETLVPRGDRRKSRDPATRSAQSEKVHSKARHIRLHEIFELVDHDTGKEERVIGWPALSAVTSLAISTLRCKFSAGNAAFTSRDDGHGRVDIYRTRKLSSLPDDGDRAQLKRLLTSLR